MSRFFNQLLGGLLHCVEGDIPTASPRCARPGTLRRPKPISAHIGCLSPPYHGFSANNMLLKGFFDVIGGQTDIHYRIYCRNQDQLL